MFYSSMIRHGAVKVAKIKNLIVKSTRYLFPAQLKRIMANDSFGVGGAHKQSEK